jgi:hypothetical protein
MYVMPDSTKSHAVLESAQSDFSHSLLGFNILVPLHAKRADARLPRRGLDEKTGPVAAGRPPRRAGPGFREKEE